MQRPRITLVRIEVDASWQSFGAAVAGVVAVLWLAYWWVMV